MALVVKKLLANAGDIRDAGSILGREDPLEEGMASIPVFLSGESHGQRSLQAEVHRVTKSQTQLR